MSFNHYTNTELLRVAHLEMNTEGEITALILQRFEALSDEVVGLTAVAELIEHNNFDPKKTKDIERMRKLFDWAECNDIDKVEQCNQTMLDHGIDTPEGLRNELEAYRALRARVNAYLDSHPLSASHFETDLEITA